jgi:spore maturation protein CgeB
MPRPWRILYVGPLWHGGTCLQRFKALRQMGHQVEGIDTEPPQVHKAKKRLGYRISCKLFQLGLNNFGPRDLAGANRNILERFYSESWDVLWLDKGLTIEPQTLLKVKNKAPQTIIVGYSPDDMFGRHNQSRQFLHHLPFYDIYFTTKSYGVEELKNLGCPMVIFIGNAYDPEIHKPMTVSLENKQRLGGQVGFIGAYESDRAASLHYLALNKIKLRVWGPGWHHCRFRSKHLYLEHKSLWGDQYALGINAFDINLCFLRKVNRDLQTTRSIEIPACGAFMLAERTDEHLALFEEGKEAEFFSSDEELLDKVRHYLSHDVERRRIALAGRERCLKSSYSYQHRLQQMLQEIEKLRL